MFVRGTDSVPVAQVWRKGPRLCAGTSMRGMLVHVGVLRHASMVLVFFIGELEEDIVSCL
jgi:hypothetical protein